MPCPAQGSGSLLAVVARNSSGHCSLLSCPVQGSGSLLAVAVSDDGRMLAVGGGDRIVHVWDARSRQYIQVQLRRAVLVGEGVPNH